MNKIQCIFLLSFGLIGVVWANASETSVVEWNAEQGLNDTINRFAPDFATVSLCVADPTDQSQDYLGITGHTFLRLKCSTFGLDYCCSYESERIKGQLWDFIRGKLKMGMRAVPTEEYLEDYRVWKRAVHEYRLNLPPDAELRLWEQMDAHVLHENMVHMNLVRYGCANTILRYVERALKPDTISYHWPEKYYTQTAAEIIQHHLSIYPWTALGFKIIGWREFKRCRTPKQKVIMPMDLLEVWSLATINGEPLLAYKGDIVEAEPVLVKKSWFTPQFAGILFLILACGCSLLFILRKRNRK